MTRGVPKRAILTWDGVAEAVRQLPQAQQDFAEEIIEHERRRTADGDAAAGGPWYLVSATVSGHMGIGERPVAIRFAAANGLTVVTARNGTGKTSLVDGIRHAVSNGRARGFDVVETNLHHPDRSITVTLGNGQREVEIVCDADGVRWAEPGVPAGPVPRGWEEAFERYLPILLHPEISPVINKPSDLHNFLKEALALGVLNRLLKLTSDVKNERTALEKDLDDRWKRAAEACAESGVDELTEAVNRARTGLTPEAAIRLREQATALPATVAAPPPLLALWTVDETAVTEIEAGIAELDQARSRVVSGADDMQRALDRLLAPDSEYVAVQRASDTCPVCGTTGAGWVEHARAEAERLRGVLANVTAAREAVEAATVRLRTLLPPVLTGPSATALLGSGDPEAQAHVAQWRDLRTRAQNVSAETVTTATVRELTAASADLAAWYGPVAAAVQAQRDRAVGGHTVARKAVTQWLDAAAEAAPALARSAAAAGLSTQVTKWIRDTRDIIFEPIGDEMVRVWSQLNDDTDLKLSDVDLGGGVKQAQKIKYQLSVDGTPVDATKAAIMSTGQRNALSLAAYLPRATQPESPFRFLVLDDPIHAFDEHRVRALAKELTRQAEHRQVIVFTHDDRLWRELKALGYDPEHQRLRRAGGQRSQVQVESASRPGEQLLQDLRQVLTPEASSPLGDDAARAVMTLALCRQAVDTAVIAQAGILGRRLELDDEGISQALDKCHRTRDQLKLLNTWAAQASLSTADFTPYDQTIQALNDAAHGDVSGTMQDCQKWLAESETLVGLVHAVTA